MDCQASFPKGRSSGAEQSVQLLDQAYKFSQFRIRCSSKFKITFATAVSAARSHTFIPTGSGPRGSVANLLAQSD